MQFTISPYQFRTLFGTASDRKMVAVCDNDMPTRAFVCDLLEEHGYTTFGCDISTKCIQPIQRYHPDLLLVDISPGQLALVFQFLEMLHTAPTTAGIPVVVVSTDRELLVQEWWRIRDQEYSVVPKPLDRATLLQTVAHCLGQGLLERCSSR